MTGVVLGLALLAGAGFDWPAVVVVLGAVAVWFLTRRRRIGLAVAVVMATVVGAWRVEPLPEQTIDAAFAARSAFRGQVVSGPVRTGRFARVSLRDETGVVLCASVPLAPRLVLNDLAVLQGRAEPAGDAPRGAAAFLKSRGCGASLFAYRVTRTDAGGGVGATLDRFRQRLTGVLQSAYPGDTGALLSGLVTGDDAFLAEARREAFFATGTTHLTAVSGSNLATLVAMLAVLGAWLGGRHRFLWQALTLSAIWVYVAMIGLPPPAFRAAIVATLALIALRLGRRPDFVTLALLVAAVEIIARPADFWTLSYRLSTAATLGLVLGLSGRRKEGWRGLILAAVLATTAAQMATAPFLVESVGRVSPWSILANVIVGPLCAAALPIALAASLLGQLHPAIGMVAAAPAALLARIVLMVVSALAELPGSSAGSVRVNAVWTWPMAVAAVLAIAGLSAECRGGVRRLVGDARRLDRTDVLTMGGGVAGAALTLVALVLR